MNADPKTDPLIPRRQGCRRAHPMNANPQADPLIPLEVEESVEPRPYDFGLSRRGFVQILGAGLLIAAAPQPAFGQRRGARGPRGLTVAARLHLGANGILTLMTGKVEMGQGARAELTQAAAEELRVPAAQVQLIMGDTSLVPDDGITAGSRSTPSTVPAIRQAAAAARNLLVELARQRWNVDSHEIEVHDGALAHAATGRVLNYADLAKADEATKAFAQAIPPEVTLTPVSQWKVLGTSVARPNRRDLVNGAHRFPSDIVRPGMLYGKVLRPPSFGAKLTGIDLAPAKAMKNVVVVQDGPFVGVAAPTTFLATQALNAMAKTAVWETAPHPSSQDVFTHLKERAQRGDTQNPFATQLGQASKVLRQTYSTAYLQHAPLEPRVAAAEWNEGRLTVWTGTQNPFGYHAELARAFHLPNDRVRVIVPDFGGGFGGKHTGEAALEAARLAQAAGRPVLLQWTRVEEFTWAYFRPAAVIEIEAGLDANGSIAVWHFLNFNSGGAAIESPYKIAHARCRFVPSESPLRQGSYRALAATANNFARESFMDELAAAAGADPLEYRLAHLDHPRLRAVLETAARRFDWAGRKKKSSPNTGIGLACGTEKGSFVATCVEIAVDAQAGKITVKHLCEVFECGPILNPANLLAQVQGCIIMGLGGALGEAMQFENGRILNPSFRSYRVPRFKDVPDLDIHLLNRPDLTPAGGGETPIIAVAPAIANALFQATGTRIRQMPIRFA